MIALSTIYETIHRGVRSALYTCFIGRICTASSRLNYKDFAGPQAAIEISLHCDFLFSVYAWEPTMSAKANVSFKASISTDVHNRRG